MISNWKVSNNKILRLIEIYNLYFIHFSISLCSNNSKFEFQNLRTFKIILGYQSIFKWKSEKQRNSTTHRDLQPLFRSLFYMTKFERSKFWISKDDKFKQGFVTLNDFSWKSHEYQSFITHQDLQSLFRSFFSFEKVIVYIVH